VNLKSRTQSSCTAIAFGSLLLPSISLANDGAEITQDELIDARNSEAVAGVIPGSRTSEAAGVGAAIVGNASDDSTVIYGPDFISQQTGLVSVADLILRIPGGSSLLQQDRSSSQRGFSNGNDRILINGKRLSGKQNDSRTALSQISINQVSHVELIRGSSPDIKVSSQSSLINVVLREDAGGSGAWQANAFIAENADPRFGGNASFNSSLGIMDYTVSAETRGFDTNASQRELLFDGTGNPLRDLRERRKIKERFYDLRSNLTFNLENGDLAHLNGLYKNLDQSRPQPGNFLLADTNGELTIAGTGLRTSERDNSEWEIGGDYETSFGENWQLRILGLHTEKNNLFNQAEDEDILADIFAEDFRAISDVFAAESIARASIVWAPSETHRLELGSEISLNKQVVGLQFFLRENTNLIEQNVDASDVTIKETRDETFAIHSWQISDALSLDSSLFFEYSKISQTGAILNERTFTFLKPSWDLRYNISSNDQLQLSARRIISQLNFGDFASSVSEDNDVIGGNKDLAPERSWLIEASYEHRLSDDRGSIKPQLFYERYANKLDQIETSPGISGAGNAGVGTRYGLGVEGALRFWFIGLPNLQLSGNLSWQKTQINDSFTGLPRIFNGRGNGIGGQVRLRHDISEHGLSWGGSVSINRRSAFRDIDEETIFPRNGTPWLNVFIEKEIFDGVIFRVQGENLLDPDFGRTRSLFNAGRAGGLLTSFEERDMRWRRRLLVSIRGTF
jgi:Outer membrane protein beta-barrel family/TonB-dependent Receptor Plug Domain